MASKSGERGNRPTFTDQEALLFHSQGRPGKLEVVATKPMATQRDLSLAYSPGVAVPVLAIAEDESRAYDYTTKGNFVAVITNGTAILGLGNRGALAAKPVMEGKAVLFKRFADVDSIDLEVSTEDTDAFVDCVKLSGEELGRHQSRRHQGAGMFHHRAKAARAFGHSGFPRRPARHRDHRRRRADQCA
jgi:malate dehydrogenase (oxaloacetate-decarboxylating)(NADP+)